MFYELLAIFWSEFLGKTRILRNTLKILVSYWKFISFKKSFSWGSFNHFIIIFFNFLLNFLMILVNNNLVGNFTNFQGHFYQFLIIMTKSKHQLKRVFHGTSVKLKIFWKIQLSWNLLFSDDDITFCVIFFVSSSFSDYTGSATIFENHKETMIFGFGIGFLKHLKIFGPC